MGVLIEIYNSKTGELEPHEVNDSVGTLILQLQMECDLLDAENEYLNNTLKTPIYEYNENGAIEFRHPS